MQQVARLSWLKTFRGPLVGLVGLSALLFFAPAAVAVTLVGLLLALGGMFAAATPAASAAFYLAIAAHGVAVAVGSGNALLGAAVAVAPAFSAPSAALVRRFGYRAGAVDSVGLVLGLVLLVAARPWGWWGLAAAPVFLLMVVDAMLAGQMLQQFKKLARPDWNLRAGDEVPDFTRQERAGGEFRLSEQRGQWVLLCFLRGDWCPICQVKMRIYREMAPVLARHGVKLVAVSPSEGPAAQDLARVLGVDYVLLADPDSLIARSFGAMYPDGMIKGKQVPIPASFLIDPAGRLRHASKPDDLGTFMDVPEIVRHLQPS